MKTLSRLKMSEFVDIACGNASLIIEKGESPTEDEVKKHIGHLVMEYKSIINPSGMKAVISQQKQNMVRSARIYILKMCITLLTLDDIENVRDILLEMGWRCGSEEKECLLNKVKSEIRRLEFEEKRLSSSDSEVESVPTEHDLRAMFDKEQAALMTFYKMHFTMETVTASVYANMVAQAEREITIRKKALKIH